MSKLWKSQGSSNTNFKKFDNGGNKMKNMNKKSGKNSNSKTNNFAKMSKNNSARHGEKMQKSNKSKHFSHRGYDRDSNKRKSTFLQKRKTENCFSNDNQCHEKITDYQSTSTTTQHVIDMFDEKDNSSDNNENFDNDSSILDCNGGISDDHDSENIEFENDSDSNLEQIQEDDPTQCQIQTENALNGEDEDQNSELLTLGNVKINKFSDMNYVKQRIFSILCILKNFKEYKSQCISRIETQEEDGDDSNQLQHPISRQDLIDEIGNLFSIYFEMSTELANYFLSILGPQETFDFLEASHATRPLTIRVNTLKTRKIELYQNLTRRGCALDDVGQWCKNVGLKVITGSDENGKFSKNIPIGATPEYLCGHYIIQSASSFIPVIALSPLPGEKILDMSAAPGGKTTHIGQLMKNKGLIFANEINKDRCNALTANIHRMGITNCIVVNKDGKELTKYLPLMDRVLLDAPCTGLGIISRDPTVKTKRTLEDILGMRVLQKELIKCAFDLVDCNSKTGGYLVYSTCSISVEENEEVIDYLLKVRDAKLVPLDNIDFGVNGISKINGKHYNPSIKEHCRRFYPHTNNIDGFFVAKIKKVSNKIPMRIKKNRSKHNPHVKVWDESTIKKNPSLCSEFLEFGKKNNKIEKRIDKNNSNNDVPRKNQKKVSNTRNIKDSIRNVQKK